MTVPATVETDLLAMLASPVPQRAAPAPAPATPVPITRGLVAVTSVSEYDDAMGQQAAEAHDVIARSGLAAPGPRPTQLIFTDTAGRVRVVELDQDPAVVRPRSSKVVIDVIEAEVPVENKPDVTRPVPVLFADDATVRRVIAGLRGTADRNQTERRRYLSAANRLTLVASMRFSVLRPVLTRVLQHRFWISKRHNAHRWQEWASAWSGTARIARSAGQLELLFALVELAYRHGGTAPLLDSVRSALVIKEAAAWRRAASSQAVHTHSTYRSVTEFEAAWNEANLADPLLHERNALSGDLAVGTVLQSGGSTQILLNNTPRFNDTNLWATSGGQRFKVARQHLITGPENTLILMLHTNQAAARAVDEARTGNLTVTMYPQRFTMPTATPKADNIWLNRPEKPWTPRPVPADVLLAGAPD